MAFAQLRRAEFGELLGGAFAELAAIRRELAIYLVAAGLFGIAGSWGQSAGVELPGLFSLTALAAYFYGQYWLYRAMLRKAGLLRDDRTRFFRFAGMAAVIVVPVLIGINFFIIPGIILASKWIMAPAFLVADEHGLIAAMGESWRASHDNTTALALVFTVLVLIWAVTAGLFSGLLNGMADELRGPLMIQALPILLMGLSMSAYRRLNGDEGRLGDIFA